MKLLRALLALTLLASFAHAAPEGWEHRNGAWRNTGVAQQADAIERGGAFYLNIEDKRLDMMPWADGSGDVLSMRPVLAANNLTLTSELVETNYGWQADMLNGDTGNTWKLRLVDSQSEIVSDAYDQYLANGLALVYTIPIADVPLSGIWTPKRIRFDGIANDCTFAIQPLVSNLPDAIRPKWVPGSIAIYHNTKQNNGGFRKYTTGKIAHLPRPLLVGRNANGITGYAFGEYRAVSGQPYQFDKVFDMDAILAQPSQTITKFGIGAPTSIHVSADIGLTTIGASTQVLNTYETIGASIGSATEDGDVTRHEIYWITTPSSSNRFSAVYIEGSTPYPTTPVGGALRGETSPTTQGGGWTGGWDASHTISNGDDLWLMTQTYNAASDTAGIRYDSVAGNYIAVDNGAPAVTSAPDPFAFAGSGSVLDSFKTSAYITYTAAAATPVTTNVAVDDSTPTKGDSIALTADIDSGNTITAAEYYIGAVDPGEGLATSMTLSPVSGTSVVASATVDTTSLTSGTYDIHVRGYDATGGWGATDSVSITVSLPVITDLAATGGDEVVNLTWTDNAVYTTGYLIKWDTVSPPTANSIDYIGDPPYQHTGRTNGVEYFYTVAGKDGGSGSPGTASAIVSATAGVSDPSGGAGLNLGIGLGL